MEALSPDLGNLSSRYLKGVSDGFEVFGSNLGAFDAYFSHFDPNTPFKTDLQQAEDFFKALWPEDLGGPHHLALCDDKGFNTEFFSLNGEGILAAAKRIVNAEGRRYFSYVHCCAHDPAKVRIRGRVESATLLPGVWADIDIDEVKPGRGYPPIETVMDFLYRQIEHRPTMVIISGGGIHAWWLFKEPLDIRSYPRLVEGWQAYLSRRLGYKIDKTGDLARVMRIPGTINRKDDYGLGRPVFFLYHSPADREAAGLPVRRYDVSDLLEYVDVFQATERRSPSAPPNTSIGAYRSTKYHFPETPLEPDLPTPKLPFKAYQDEYFANWVRNPLVGMVIAQKILGLPVSGLEVPGASRSFCCRLPGHHERNPSASLWHSPSGEIVYREFHDRGGPKEGYTLAEVFAFLRYGRVKRISPQAIAVWHLRLLVNTGLLSPAEVNAAPLKGMNPKSVRTLYEAFLDLLGCRWLYAPGEPSPFTYDFARAWGWDGSDITFKRARKALMDNGYLTKDRGRGAEELFDDTGPVPAPPFMILPSGTTPGLLRDYSGTTPGLLRD